VVKQSNKNNKVERGNSSQFFVAGELCRRGYAAVVTLGNTPNTDILCSNRAGTKFVHIQVKTFVPGNTTCTVGKKAEISVGPNFFWVLAGIPPPNTDGDFQYFIIPSAEMSKNVLESFKLWLSEPGKKGQVRNDSNIRTVHLPPRASYNGWSIKDYLNRWDLIESCL